MIGLSHTARHPRREAHEDGIHSLCIDAVQTVTNEIPAQTRYRQRSIERPMTKSDKKVPNVRHLEPGL